jgi:hypothetical protein
VALVCELTIPTERPPLVGEASANFFGWRGVAWSVRWIPYGRNLGILDRTSLIYSKLKFILPVTLLYERFLDNEDVKLPPYRAFSRMKRTCKMRCVEKGVYVQETPTKGRTSNSAVYLTYSFCFFAPLPTVISLPSSISVQALST